MKILSSTNSQICYDYIQGNHNDQAEILVLIHNIGLNMDQWNDIIPYLQKDYKLLRYDLRGHGNSKCQDVSICLEDLHEDLICLLEHLQVEEFHLISDLAGGRIVIKLANLFSERLKSLVLGSAVCFFPAFITNKMINHFLNWLDKDHDSLVRHLSKHLNYLPSPERMEFIYRMMISVRPEVLKSYFHILLKNYPPNFFKTWTIPTLYLVGENNPLLPWKLSSTFFQFTRNLIVPDASQLISMDQPLLVASWIKDFISSLQAEKEIKLDDRLNTIIKGHIKDIIHIYTTHSKAQTMDHMHVELLHTFRVFLNDKEVIGNWNRRLAKRIFLFLLVYRAATREQLYDVFWPRLNLIKAQNHLRVALNHLKKLLTPEGRSESPFLWSDREHIGLRGKITSDLSEFIKKLEEDVQLIDPQQSYLNSIDILNMFEEHFLPGIYDDWLVNYRSYLEEKALVRIQESIALLMKFCLDQKASYLRKRLKECNLCYLEQIEKGS